VESVLLFLAHAVELAVLEMNDDDHIVMEDEEPLDEDEMDEGIVLTLPKLTHINVRWGNNRQPHEAASCSHVSVRVLHKY
jgi:hypothetical protein